MKELSRPLAYQLENFMTLRLDVRSLFVNLNLWLGEAPSKVSTLLPLYLEIFLISVNR